MEKTLWFISELYYPETTSTGHILTKIAEGLVDTFAVKVICGQPSYSARGVKAPSHETYNGVEINRCWGTTLDKDIFPLRMINLITITVSIFIYALRRLHQNDLVTVVTNPPALPFAVAAACRIKGAKCTLIVHDVYPELAIAAGKLPKDSLLTRLLDMLNTRLYRDMDCIFVLGRDMQAKVIGKVETQKDRVVIATNWADLDMISPRSRNENILLRELGLHEKFVLQYAGNMGYPNDIETIIEAATMLKKRPDIHFLFIGSGAKKQLIVSAVEKNGLHNVTILGQRSRDDQINFLNACDIAVIALVVGMKGVSVPSRTYNTLASGKPIIAIVENGSELALVIEEEGVGWVVEPGQPHNLASDILKAKSQPHLLAQMGLQARNAAENKYSFELTLQVIRKNLLAIANPQTV